MNLLNGGVGYQSCGIEFGVLKGFQVCFIFSTSSKMSNCESESGTFIFCMVSIGYTQLYDMFGMCLGSECFMQFGLSI